MIIGLNLVISVGDSKIIAKDNVGNVFILQGT
jgi:hypothetical protein